MRKVMLIDISKARAHRHRREQYVDLAVQSCCTLCTGCGLLPAAGSGSTLRPWRRRDLFGDCLQVHILPAREDDQDRRTRDDFVIEGGQEDLDWNKGVLANKYLVKVRSILGPERQDDKVADILNRVVERHDDELLREADPRYVEKMLEDIGLEDYKQGPEPSGRRSRTASWNSTGRPLGSTGAPVISLLKTTAHTVHGQGAVPRDELSEDAQLGSPQETVPVSPGSPADGTESRPSGRRASFSGSSLTAIGPAVSGPGSSPMEAASRGTVLD